MGRKIAVVSGKGGVGKTTIVAGLGMALAKSGANVCLVDLDIGLNNLDILFNIENKIVYDLGDCLSLRCRIKQALIQDPILQNLYILPSQKSQIDKYDAFQMRTVVDKLAEIFDFVILDAPAGINDNFYLATKSTDEAIVVVTPHVSSLRDADKVISVLKGLGRPNVAFVINRIRGDMVARKEMMSHLQIENLLKIPLLGVLPESDDINIYSSFHFSKIARGGLFLAFSTLSANLRTDQKKIYDYDGKYKGFLGMIRRNIKRSI